MDSVSSVLADLGLNAKEIDAYLALLSSGSTTASIIARKTGMNRSTSQYTCQQLAKKGVVNMVQRNNAYLFTVESPKKLLLLLEKEHRKIKEKEQGVSRIIGTLEQMINPLSMLPKVQYYEGKDGLCTLYKSILDLRSPIDSFEEKGDMVALIPEAVENFIRTRMENGLWNRVICPSASPINKESAEELRSVRTLPTESYPFSCDVKICKDQVSIISFDKNIPVGISIHHTDIARNFRLLFETMWTMLGTRTESNS